MRNPHIAGWKMHSTLLGLIFLFLPVRSSALAQGEDGGDPARKTNLEIFRGEIASIAEELVQKSNLRSERNLFVNVRSPDTSWAAPNSLLEALKRLNYNVFLSLAGERGKVAILDLGFVEARVRYGPAFREGLLGKRKTERTVSTVISGNVRDAKDEIVFAGSLSRTFRDTVRVGELTELENPAIPFTRGEPPEGGFFDNVLEPLVLIGASAVVIYLFFTVRS